MLARLGVLLESDSLLFHVTGEVNRHSEINRRDILKCFLFF